MLLTPLTQAQPVSVAVGEAKVKKSVIALIAANTNENSIAQANDIAKTIEADLNFIAQFTLLPKGGFAQPQISAFAQVKFADWAKTGTDYLAFSTAKIEGKKISLRISSGQHRWQ